MRFGPRVGRTAIWLGIQMISVFSTGCESDEAPRAGRKADPPEPTRMLPIKIPDSGTLADPQAPVGDLASEVERFTDLAACAAERAKLDPLVADALTSIGYDTFLLDACRVLAAVKKKDAGQCRPISSSPLRAQCERGVALVTAAPDVCPLVVASAPTSGRDPTCLAAATGDARFCAAELGDARHACLAFATHELSHCAKMIAGRASCERASSRWKSLFAAAKGGPPFAVRSELLVSRNSAGDMKSSSTADVERGVVLSVSAIGVRFSVGDLRDLGVVAHSAQITGARIGCAIVAPKVGEARVENCELEVPGAIVMRAKPKVTLSVPTFTRGDRVDGTVDGDFVSGTTTVHAHWTFSTFVRDVVR